MEGKVAVLGDADFVMPFSALGVDTYPVGRTPGDVAAAARRILDAGCALVVVAENIAPAAEQTFQAFHDEPTPCIVVVPFTAEPAGYATKDLARVLKIATGIDILQNA